MALFTVEDVVSIPVGVSNLGNLVFSNIIIEGLKIDEALISVSNDKNIIVTDIAGRNGSVKEYINRGDYQININGFIVAPFGNVFPIARVRELRRICELEREISISGAFLNHFNITTVVVDDWAISEEGGTHNSIPFSLSLLSETPIEIKVNA